MSTTTQWPDDWKDVRKRAQSLLERTKDMRVVVHYARASKAKNLIVATEAGMLHRLKKEVPEKNFIPGPTDNCNCAECRFMKMNTLEKLHDCLKNLAPEITMPEDIRARAEKPIRRMLELSS